MRVEEVRTVEKIEPPAELIVIFVVERCHSRLNSWHSMWGSGRPRVPIQIHT
jgi:hypothetical protein